METLKIKTGIRNSIIYGRGYMSQIPEIKGSITMTKEEEEKEHMLFR